MAELRECKACRKMQAEKHKYDKVWKIIAVVSTIIAVVFICLYFGSGAVVETTEVENEVQVTNYGGENLNKNIGNIQLAEKNNINVCITIIVSLCVLTVGGVAYGCIVAKSKNQKQSDDQ